MAVHGRSGRFLKLVEGSQGVLSLAPTWATKSASHKPAAAFSSCGGLFVSSCGGLFVLRRPFRFVLRRPFRFVLRRPFCPPASLKDLQESILCYCLILVQKFFLNLHITCSFTCRTLQPKSWQKNQLKGRTQRRLLSCSKIWSQKVEMIGQWSRYCEIDIF